MKEEIKRARQKEYFNRYRKSKKEINKILIIKLKKIRFINYINISNVLCNFINDFLKSNILKNIIFYV